MKNTLVLLMFISGFCRAQTTKIDYAARNRYSDHGDQLSSKGLYREAIDSFCAALSIDSTDWSSYEGRANAEYELGDYKSAVADYTWVINKGRSESHVTNWDLIKHALLNRALAEIYLKDFKNALADCDLLIKNIRDEWKAYAIKGEARYAMGDYPEAIKYYDTILHNEPYSFYQYYYRRASARYALRDYTGASADSVEGKSHAPPAGQRYPDEDDVPVALPLTAISYPPEYDPWLMKYKKDSVGTMAELKGLINADPKKGFYYYSRGLIEQSQGHITEACADFERAISLGEHDAKFLIDKYCK